MTDTFNPHNLLVRTALEATLSKKDGRNDIAARKQRLLAAALMECAEKGYPSLAIADIAKRAKVSTATIYGDYKDRDALLVSAIEMLFDILSKDVIDVPKTANPVEKIEQLLLAHGNVYAEPLATWMFRLHATLAWSGHEHLHDIGYQIFKGIDRFWAWLLQQLVDEGHLVPLDPSVVIPLILGPVERSTIISRLGFGDSDVDRLELPVVAHHSAQTLFRVWGSEAFWNGPYSAGLVRPAAGAVDLPTPAQSQRTLTAPDLRNRLRPSKELSASQRTKQILSAAETECRERGYNAASMREVAARAQVSTATLYKLYQDKTDLFSSALEKSAQRAQRKLKSDSAQGGSRANLADIIFEVAARAFDPQHVWVEHVIMASEISGSARVVKTARTYRDIFEHKVAQAMADRMATPLSTQDEVKLATNFLLGATERAGVLSLILFGLKSVDPSELNYLSQLASVIFTRLYEVEQSAI